MIESADNRLGDYKWSHSPLGGGHASKNPGYWKDDDIGNAESEFFAEVNSAVATNPESLKLIKQYFPILFCRKRGKGMTEEKFLRTCRFEIAKYYLESEDIKVDLDDIYAVWVCKILQSNKALLSTNNPDGLYFECTYNGDKHELYLDVYKRQKNTCFKITD